MKNRLSVIALSSVLMLASCSYDNYDEPTSVLKGRVTYKNQAVEVRTDGTGLSIWQDGYDFKTVVPVKIAQDGSYSVVLFDGEYKMTRNVGGPWVNQPADTMRITVRGNTIVDVPVTPYFTINDASFQYSNGKITATFKVGKEVEAATLSRLTLCIGKSVLTDYNKKEANTTYNDPVIQYGEKITMTVDVPAELANAPYVYARIGARAAESSSNEFTYTASTKVTK